MKDIKEIIHLYKDCEVLALCDQTEKNEKGYLTGFHGEYGPEVQFIINGNAEESPSYPGIENIKLILRRLSSMTEDEAIELYQIIIGIVVFNIAITILNNAVEIRSVEHKAVINLGFDGTIVLYEEHERTIYQQRVPYPKAFIHLLKKGFWIFDESAFDQGLIIDKATI